jgi:hypothetical protein
VVDIGGGGIGGERESEEDEMGGWVGKIKGEEDDEWDLCGGSWFEE